MSPALLRSLKIFALGFFVGAIVLTVYRNLKADRPPSWEERDAIAKKLDAELREQAKEIETMQGHGLCLTHADCHILGLGSKVCKGYKTFLIYSSQDADSGGLLAAVKRFNESAEKLGNLSLDVPSCGEAEGEVQCLKGHCIPAKR